MTRYALLEDVASRLDGVRRSGSGIMARCPAHSDRSPSLSLTERDGKILLHCFAGCTISAITESLGISVKDLFIDAPSNPRDTAQHMAQRERQHRERELRREADGHMIDVCKMSQWLVGSRCDLDIAPWSDEQLNDELNALADAYSILESEGLQ